MYIENMIEIILILIFVYYFIKKEKPKKRFFIYGFLISIIVFIFKLPINFLIYYIQNQIEIQNTSIPILLIMIFSIIITEIARYLSLKRYFKSKSYKNGILFGIGWATFSSLLFLHSVVIDFLKSINLFQNNNLGSMFVIIEPISMSIIPFIFLFLLNIAQSTLIIISIIKKNIFYIIYSILLGIFCNLIFLNNNNNLIVELIIILIIFFIVFHYRKIK
jgi:hypothetical protein